MPDIIRGLAQPALILGGALLLVDFLVFMRAWGMEDGMRLKSILKLILKIDAGILASGLFIYAMAAFANFLAASNSMR